MVNTGYNIQSEVCTVYGKFFDQQENKLNELIDKIAHGNTDAKTVSNLVNKLTHLKKTSKKGNFSDDPEVRQWIDHIHERNPTIFGNGSLYFFKDEDSIDVVVQALDGELKMISTEMNQHMMLINNEYETRSQMTENSRQILKEASDFLQSIVRKQRAGG